MLLGYINIVMGNTVKVTGAVVPQDMNNREILEVGACNIKEGFWEGEGRVDDDVDGNNSQGRVNFSPLEVMFRANLNGRWRSKTEGDDGMINGTMTELSFSFIGLKGS